MYERLLMTFAVMVFFASVFLLVKRRQLALANLASQELKKQTNIPTIVYFWSPGCPVCKMIQRRILEGIIAEYGRERLALTAYNTDEAPDVAKEWGVRTLPTTFLLDSTGAIIYISNGLADAEALRSQLDPMMNRRCRS